MEEKDIIMEDKELNEQESLKLITQMIQNTRRNLDTGSGNMFLLWGYVSAIVTFGSFCRNLLDEKSCLDVGLLGSSGFRLSL